MTDAVPPAQSRTEAVVDGIKTMITSGVLSAGSRLPVEKDLAFGLGVSRSSLREGVRALASMGVLETHQGDGTYVTSLEPSLLLAPMSFLVDLHGVDNMVHIQAVRRVLETEAAGRAARFIDEAAISQAAEILESVKPFVNRKSLIDYEVFIEADIAFHGVVAHASGNPALEALIGALASRTIRARTWRAIFEDGALAVTHAEHVSILTSLTEHDPEGARLRMGTHLLAVQEFMQNQPGDLNTPP